MESQGKNDINDSSSVFSYWPYIEINKEEYENDDLQNSEYNINNYNIIEEEKNYDESYKDYENINFENL